MIIFKELCLSQMKNRIKEHPEYDSVLNNPLKIMGEIAQPMHNPICATYPYLKLTESLAIMMNTRKNEKEGFVDYIDRFKQDNIIVKILTGEKFWVVLSKKRRNLRDFMK